MEHICTSSKHSRYKSLYYYYYYIRYEGDGANQTNTTK